MKSLNNVLMRIVAVFAAVVEKLARAFMDDGKLTLDEINAAFSAVDKGAKTVADVEVENRQISAKAAANVG
jgi:hypothetical protein